MYRSGKVVWPFYCCDPGWSVLSMYRKIYSHANSIRVLMMMMTHLHTQAKSGFLPPLLGIEGLKCIATCRTGTQEKRVKLLPKRVQLPLCFFCFCFCERDIHSHVESGIQAIPIRVPPLRAHDTAEFRTDRSLCWKFYCISPMAQPSW